MRVLTYGATEEFILGFLFIESPDDGFRYLTLSVFYIFVSVARLLTLFITSFEKCITSFF